MPASLPTAVSGPDKRSLKYSQTFLLEGKVRIKAVFKPGLNKSTIHSFRAVVWWATSEFDV